VDTATDTLVELAGEGIDQVSSSAAAYTLAANIENGRVIAAGAANLSGNTLANVLFAGAGDNVLDGAAGLDTASYLYATSAVTVSLALAGAAQATGGSGSYTLISIEHLTGSNFADSLRGDNNANVLRGGTGADKLVGGLGNDTLLGGADADRFVFDTALNATTNVDRIGDFAASDLISLDNDVFTALGAAGALAAGRFTAGAGVVGNSGTGGIFYDTSTGNLYYDPDGAGAQVATKFANLTGAPVLNVNSFVVAE
jgi:Ca2+-binding RTX toxin-like protein